MVLSVFLHVHTDDGHPPFCDTHPRACTFGRMHVHAAPLRLRTRRLLHTSSCMSMTTWCCSTETYLLDRLISTLCWCRLFWHHFRNFYIHVRVRSCTPYKYIQYSQNITSKLHCFSALFTGYFILINNYR